MSQISQQVGRSAVPKSASIQLAQEGAAVAGAGIAFAICSGVPALLMVLTAIGVGALAQHAYMFPVFVAAVGLNLWLLHNDGARLRAYRPPFWAGVAFGVSAVAAFWLSVTGFLPAVWWWSYVGLVGMLAASVWSFVHAQRAESCADEPVRAVAVAASTPASPTRRLANGAAISIAAAAAFYGMYKSVDVFVPKADAADIACYGINACKGQTQCATAFNKCPGLNSCKGKGFRYVPAPECANNGGVPLKGSPADPMKG